MKDKIEKAIRRIIRKKYADGEILPCAHSIEVAHKLKMNTRDVELIAKDIEGIITHLTINGEYYEI